MKKIILIFTLLFTSSVSYSLTNEELKKINIMLDLSAYIQGTYSIDGKNLNLELYNDSRLTDKIVKICNIIPYDEKNRRLNIVGMRQIILEHRKILKTTINVESNINDLKKAAYLKLQLCSPDDVLVDIQRETSSLKKGLQKIIGEHTAYLHVMEFYLIMKAPTEERLL